MENAATNEHAVEGAAPAPAPATPPGFVCGFAFHEGRAAALDWSRAAGLPAAPGVPLWLHLSGADPAIHAWLQGADALPSSVREFLAGEDRRPRVHVGTNCLYGVISDFELGGGADIDKGKSALRFYIDASRLITVRASPLESTDRLRLAVLDGDVFRDTIDLFASLIRGLNETFADNVNDLADRLDDVEEGVLDGRHKDQRTLLAAIRRDLVELKRYVDPERTALAQLLAPRLEWANPRSLEALVQSIQTLNSIGGSLEALYERSKLLQEEMASLLAEDINRKLLALAIMSALLLPASLISGIFGMNVAGLPGMHDRYAFWIVMAAMLLLGLTTVGILKRLRLW
ncbi:MAG: CorA family divalent cation transporter [Janthinobacterium lividum]